ncbi:MAG: cyanophycin synthetase [Planctomycetota bacterium]|jgi:cyanophycin synthetase
MKTWTTLALHGPNRWSSRSVLELHASPAFASKPISTSVATATAGVLHGFLDAGNYTTTHSQSVSTAARSIAEIRSASTRGALWGAIAHWMTAMAGVPSRFLALAAPNGTNASDAMIPIAALEMEEELLSLRAYEHALELLEAKESGLEFPIATKFRELFDYADDVRLGPSSRAILDAAIQRAIPYYRMTSGSLCQLGEGRWQRRIWTAETDATSAIAESIASDKDLTKRLLRNVGVPIPLGRMVTGPEDAWAAAQEVGFPVVVKPRNANHQRGISIELTEREEILRAYHWAIEDGQTQDVLVEQFARGEHHRLLVVGDRMVAASRGHVETVTGDGIHTVEQLIHNLNQDPRRGEAYTDPLGVVKVVAATHIELAKQGFTVDSIPEAGRIVLVQRTGDLTTDCTEVVHPETARQAVLAARVVGLDIAGLDVLAEDIGRPLTQQRGAVVEVNAGPSLSPHVTPLFGKPQPVGRAIIDMLFPDGRNSRVPIACIVSGQMPTGLQHRLQWHERLLASGVFAGMVEEGGIRIGTEWIPLPEATPSERVHALLSHPHLDAMAIACELGTLAERACPVPRIDYLIIVPPAAGRESSFACDDAWRTVGHAIHGRTEIEWNDTPSPLRSSIEAIWNQLQNGINP